MPTYQGTSFDQLGLLESNVGVMVLLLADTLGINESIVTNAIFPLFDKLGVSETIDNLITAQENLLDSNGLNDLLSLLISLSVSDKLGINESVLDIKRNIAYIVDTIVLQDLASNRLTALNSLSSIIGILETLQRVLPSSTIDKLGFSEDLLNKLVAAGITTDSLGMSEDLLYTVGVYVTIEDKTGIQDIPLTSQVLQELLEEGISFAITLLGPGSAVYTGWVMNSENMAVSIYNNYEFTDMARINGKYYGVKEDGVFLLNGNLDDTSFIKSIVRSAKMSFGTSSLKNMSQMYLGFRADGNPVLKMITDEKEETWYTVSESRTDLHTRRIKLAKGQIGRYWQFELVTVDSTILELDSVELLPITFKRKV